MGGHGVGEGIVNDDGRYWAFISYSHKDAAFGRRLHRRLEAYALPRRLVGRATPQGAISRRLVPIFRDREEFPAAHDLSAEVLAALKVSRCLVVVCSPAAAVSPWVAREVELFRALHPGRPVLAAIREGDPATSIPDVLRHMGPGGAPIEPLAADFRRGHDGWELGLLKLVAGIAGVGLDELVQRDSQRRTRRVTAVTASALALVLVMAVLTVFALNARSDAERQRSEAEGLAGFMSTDLRERLRSVGRLDVMSAVNQKALQYFNRQSGNLQPDARAYRAHLLEGLGEDAEARGDQAGAIENFREAFDTTAELLANNPSDPEAIFNHAQSQYWIGFFYFAAGNFGRAKTVFDEYRRLAERMLSLAPSEPRYLRELAYAEGNLCSVSLKPPKDPREALKLCLLALEHMEAAVRHMPTSDVGLADLANRHAWLADSFHANGDDVHAREHRLLEDALLGRLLKSDPMNMEFKIEWIALQRTLARMDGRAGRLEDAKSRLKSAQVLIDQMVVFDPSNQIWNAQKRKLEAELSALMTKS